MSRTRFRNGRTTLYRHYDKDGALLYVGVSNDIRKRSLSHVSSTWWEKVHVIFVEHFATRLEAEAKERKLISEENPIYNRRGKSKTVSGNADAPKIIIKPLNTPPTEEEMQLLRELDSSEIEPRSC